MRTTTNLTEEQRESIVNLLHTGMSFGAIADEVGCANQTVSYWNRKLGIRDTSGKGGIVSKSILVTPGFEKKSEERRDEDNACYAMIVNKTIELCGTETTTRYTIKTDSKAVKIDGEKLVAELTIEDLLKFSKELKSVYDTAMQLAANKYTV